MQNANQKRPSQQQESASEYLCTSIHGMEGHIFITLSHNDVSEAFFATSNDLLLYESMKELYSPFFGKLSVRMRYRKRERVRESQREIYKVLGCIWIIFLIRFEMHPF